MDGDLENSAESPTESPTLAESCPAEAAAIADSTEPATLEQLEAGVTTHFEIPMAAEPPVAAGQAASATGFPADWIITKDAAGNVTVSPPAAADGECGRDVVIGPGSVGPVAGECRGGGCDAAAVVAEAPSARPIPALGHVLCQVCKQPTNSEQQEKLADTPFVFSFNGQPRAIICFECYMNGVIAGARIAAAEMQIPVPPGG